MKLTIPQKLQDDKKVLIGGAVAFVVLLFIVISFVSGPKNSARPDQEFNIPAFGHLPPLKEAMKKNGEINNIAQKLLAHDEAYIFVNYPEVNNDMARLLFLWAGIPSKTIKEIGGQKSIPIFLRSVYGLPDDEPIMGNPLLEGNPWGDLLGRYRAIILMQGQGHKIYDGLAYYDNEKDKMVVPADLSEDFINGFAEFLNTLDKTKRKKYINNFLLYVRDTKGLKNLSDQDKILIKKLQSLK